MKNKSLILIIIIFSLVLMISCTSKEIDVKSESIFSPETDDEGIEKIPEGFILQENRSHNIEFHQDKVYGLYQRRNPEDDNWIEALWCFSPYEESKLIAEGKGLNFRVSKNNAYIATEINGDIEFYNEDGELLHTILSEQINTEEHTTVQLVKWNENGDNLWCALNETYNTIAYIKIDTETWEVVKYGDLNFMSSEHVLNPNTELIVYSDYPVFLDITSYEKYIESNEKTTLSIYNLNTKEKTDIESSVTNKFKPKWSNDNEILYYIEDKPFIYRIDKK